MKTVLTFLAFLLIAASTILWVRHGGGEAYPDLTSSPEFSANALQEVLAYSEPIGNVAVSRHGRIFFTVHPESRPQGNKLLEYVDGASVPFPSCSALLSCVLSIVRFPNKNKVGKSTNITEEIFSGVEIIWKPRKGVLREPGPTLENLMVNSNYWQYDKCQCKIFR